MGGIRFFRHRGQNYNVSKFDRIGDIIDGDYRKDDKEIYFYAFDFMFDSVLYWVSAQVIVHYPEDSEDIEQVYNCNTINAHNKMICESIVSDVYDHLVNWLTGHTNTDEISYDIDAVIKDAREINSIKFVNSDDFYYLGRRKKISTEL